MRISFPTILAIFALAACASGASAAEPLRAGGTGAAVGMIGKVGDDFAAAGGSKIMVVTGLGSGGAINALLDRKLDIAVSARPLKASEEAAGLRQFVALRTAFVLATSARNANGLNIADLPRLFADDSAAWADGSPLRLILRPRSEADNELFARMVAGMDKAIEAARLRAEVPVAATDQDNADLAEKMPGSLTGITLAQLRTEQRRLRVVALDGVTPTFANYESGKYRYTKPFYVILREDSAPETKAFAAYLQSPAGAASLRETDVLVGSE